MITTPIITNGDPLSILELRDLKCQINQVFDDYGEASITAAGMVISDKRPGTLRWVILGMAIGWALTLLGVWWVLN